MKKFQLMRRFNRKGEWEKVQEPLTEEELTEAVHTFMHYMTPHGTPYQEGAVGFVGIYPDNEVIEVSWEVIEA